MSLRNRYIFHFLANKEINEVYISTALLTLSQSLIAIFVPIYLITLNYHISQIILFYFLWSLYYFLLTPFLVKVIPKVGVKHTMLLSMPFLIIFYLCLGSISTNPYLIYILPLIITIHSSLFNSSFHINFVDHADRKKMGRELSWLYIFLNLMHLISPFVGGLLIYNFGFNLTYVIGACLVLISTMPLFFTKDTKNYKTFTNKELFNFIKSKETKDLKLSYFGYAIETEVQRIIWPIFIFLILKNIEQVGFITSLTMVVPIGVFYLVGRLSDQHKKTKLIKIGSILYSVGWVLRAFVNSALSFLVIDTYKNSSFSLLFTPWATKTYNLAKGKQNFMFIVAREILFNIPRLIFLPLLIVLFYYVPTNIAFFISFITAAVSSLLYSRINKYKNV